MTNFRQIRRKLKKERVTIITGLNIATDTGIYQALGNFRKILGKLVKGRDGPGTCGRLATSWNLCGTYGDWPTG